jgi:hypothetical protein
VASSNHPALASMVSPPKSGLLDLKHQFSLDALLASSSSFTSVDRFYPATMVKSHVHSLELLESATAAFFPPLSNPELSAPSLSNLSSSYDFSGFVSASHSALHFWTSHHDTWSYFQNDRDESESNNSPESSNLACNRNRFDDFQVTDLYDTSRLFACS